MEIQPKTFDGVPLQWSDEDQAYFYPTPEEVAYKLMFDEPKGVFLPIPKDAAMVFRERTVTTADGNEVSERVIFQTETQADLEARAAAIKFKKQQFALEMWEWALSLKPLLMLLCVVVIGVFFYGISTAMYAASTAVGVSMAAALEKVAYWLVIALGITFGLLLAKFLLPILFRRTAEDAVLFDAQAPATESKKKAATATATETNAGSVNINVNYGGAGNSAQDIIDNRKF